MVMVNTKNVIISTIEDDKLKSISGGKKNSTNSKKNRNNAIACGAGIISGALSGSAGGLASGSLWSAAAGAVIGGAVGAANHCL